MESIRELRSLCQSTRPSIFADFLSQFYYRVSIYFTWLFLKAKFSANQVTVFSGFTAALGGVLISTNQTGYVLLGCICFHLFAIFDMCDGEVARYRGTGGVNGHFLDWYLHYLTPTFFITGIWFAAYEQLQSPFGILIGVIAILIPILDKSVESAGWTVIVWTRMRNFNRGERTQTAGSEIKQEVSAGTEANFTSSPWIVRRLRLVLSTPFQDHWAPTMLMLVIAANEVLSIAHFDLPALLLWLLYVGIVGPVLLWLKVRRFVVTHKLTEGYNRVFFRESDYVFPNDDFLD